MGPAIKREGETRTRKSCSTFTRASCRPHFRPACRQMQKEHNDEYSIENGNRCSQFRIGDKLAPARSHGRGQCSAVWSYHACDSALEAGRHFKLMRCAPRHNSPPDLTPHGRAASRRLRPNL